MEQKICGVTGHREIPAEYMEQAEQGLRGEIEKAITDGYNLFYFPALLTAPISYLPGLFWKRQKKIRRCAWTAAIPYRNRYKRLMEDGQTKSHAGGHVRRLQLSARNGLPMSI